MRQSIAEPNVANTRLIRCMQAVVVVLPVIKVPLIR
jgi:hypothetical protein